MFFFALQVLMRMMFGHVICSAKFSLPILYLLCWCCPREPAALPHGANHWKFWHVLQGLTVGCCCPSMVHMLGMTIRVDCSMLMNAAMTALFPNWYALWSVPNLLPCRLLAQSLILLLGFYLILVPLRTLLTDSFLRDQQHFCFFSCGSRVCWIALTG